MFFTLPSVIYELSVISAPVQITYLNANLSLLAGISPSPEIGTADAVSDYAYLNEILRFAPDQVEALLPVNIVNDDVVEEDEFFMLQLSDAENGAIGSLDQIRIDVFNDDGKKLLQYL